MSKHKPKQPTPSTQPPPITVRTVPRLRQIAPTERVTITSDKRRKF